MGHTAVVPTPKMEEEVKCAEEKDSRKRQKARRSLPSPGLGTAPRAAPLPLGSHPLLFYLI